MRKLSSLLSFLTLVVLISCTRSFAPVDIENGDMCSFCRMAISEKQYAAEIVIADESVLKFDDIGCMLRYQKAQGETVKPAAIYVADSETKQWLKADDAYFIRSTSVKTPMGSGIIAYSSAENAGTGAIRFSELKEK